MPSILQQIQNYFFLYLVAIILIGALGHFFRSASFKGWLGENKVKHWLAQDLNTQNYCCIHNVTLRMHDGSTTQIDHIVVSPFGVFVLETKHMQGWIFGTERQKIWTQTIFKRRSTFQNPIHQNWRHVKALESVIQVPIQLLHSVIVFTGDCLLKSELPAYVAQGRECTAFIRSHQKNVLTALDVQQIVQKILQTRLRATRSTHQAHVAQLKQRHHLDALSTLPSASSMESSSENHTDSPISDTHKNT